MKTTKLQPENMDDFIALYPKEVQEKLQKLRATIGKAAPEAQETIKYGMPTFTLNGNLVFFSAYKTHIGFYPRMNAFKNELSAYEGGKVPFDSPSTSLSLGLDRQNGQIQGTGKPGKSRSKIKKKKKNN